MLLLSALPMIARKHPNVIYVFPDQFRNSAMGFWRDSAYSREVGWRGDPVFTPRLDSLARQSVVFTSALSNCPVSSAHRGMLMTGLYPNKSGVSLNCNSRRPISDLRDDCLCLSDIFAQAGYDCAYFGKLHAHYPTRNNPQAPGTYVGRGRGEQGSGAGEVVWDAYTEPSRRHGFRYWYSYGTHDEHKNPHYWDTDGNYHEPHEYSPKHEADQIIGWLNRWQQKGEDKRREEPFFIMWGINPPHSPYRSLDDCMEEDYALYRDMPTDSLLVRKNIHPDLKDKQESAAYYFANVTGVDREFGRVLDRIHELGLDENTIVIFASDHGETMCSHVRDPKNTPYTESMNIPFMVRYPKRLKPAVSHNLLSAIDIMPTVVGLAGLEKMLPDSLPGYNWAKGCAQRTMTRRVKDAPRSVLYLQNVDGDKNTDGQVVSYFARCRGVVTDRYTLCFTINRKGSVKEVMLYDNEVDPYQTHNLPLGAHMETTLMLLDEMEKQLRRADDPWIHDGTMEQVRKYVIQHK